MNLRTLYVVSGMSALLLGACKLNVNQNYDDTKCAGYLGCSAGQSFGVTVGDAGVVLGPAHQAATPGSINAVVRGPGCGQPIPDGTPTTIPGKPIGYKQFTVQGTGASLAGLQPATVGPRTFWVRVPADYDQNKAYRTIYVGQGCGPYNSANINTLTLYQESVGGNEEAIYVALDIPMDMVNMDCYDNRNGPAAQEWQAFQAFQEFIDAHYCIDENRIFIAGYSTGGWLANMWGCYFAGDGDHPWNGTPGDPSTVKGAVERTASSADGSASDAEGADGAAGTGAGTSPPAVPSPIESPPTASQRVFAHAYHIRGQAAVSGGEPPNQPACNGPVAAIWIHDAGDTSNPLSGNQSALARVLKMNGCVNSKTAPWHPENPLFKSVCVQYTDCPQDYPVVFCTTNGLGHEDDHQRAIPAFNLFFNETLPTP